MEEVLNGYVTNPNLPLLKPLNLTATLTLTKLIKKSKKKTLEIDQMT